MTKLNGYGKYSGYGRKRRKKFPVFLTIIIILVIAIVGFFGFNIYSLNSSAELQMPKLTYSIAFDNNLYFVRIINSNKKVYIIKSEDNITFKDSLITLNSKNMDKVSSDFIKEFKLDNNQSFKIKLDDSSFKDLSKIFNNQKNDFSGLLETLKKRNTGIFDFMTVFNVRGILTRDKNSNITSGGVYNLMHALKNYSASYDKFELKSDFGFPIIIKVEDKTYERKYCEDKSYELVKQSLE